MGGLYSWSLDLVSGRSYLKGQGSAFIKAAGPGQRRPSGRRRNGAPSIVILALILSKMNLTLRYTEKGCVQLRASGTEDAVVLRLTVESETEWKMGSKLESDPRSSGIG